MHDVNADGCMRQLAAADLNVGAEYSILIERELGRRACPFVGDAGGSKTPKYIITHGIFPPHK